MADIFQCPTCGAPLNAITGGTPTVECPYCHNAVIVPETMRTPSTQNEEAVLDHLFNDLSNQTETISVTTSERFSMDVDGPVRGSYLPTGAAPVRSAPARAKPKTAGIWVGIILVLVIGVGAFIALKPASSRNGPASSLVSAGAQTPAGISLILPTPTATVDAEATRVHEQAVTSLSKQKLWPVLLADPFTKKQNGWSTGDTRNSYLTGTREISGGKYRWTLTAKQSMETFTAPDMNPVSDFLVGVDIQFLDAPQDAEAGLTFRENDDDQTWYYFSIDPSGAYSLQLYNGQEWETLIDWTPSDALQAGASNRIEVSGAGSHFIFSINGQVVDQFTNDQLAQGTVELGAGLAKNGDKAVVEFGDFQIQTPK
jgi:hypothetical protein